MRPAVLAQVQGCVAAQGMAPQRSKPHKVEVARRAHKRCVGRRGRLLIIKAPALPTRLLTLLSVLLSTLLLLPLVTRPFVAVDATSRDAPAEGREQELPPSS